MFRIEDHASKHNFRPFVIEHDARASAKAQKVGARLRSSTRVGETNQPGFFDFTVFFPYKLLAQLITNYFPIHAQPISQRHLRIFLHIFFKVVQVDFASSRDDHQKAWVFLPNASLVIVLHFSQTH